MWQLRVRDHILATMSVLFVLLLFSLAVADAKGPGQLPNVMVLATGGTIAGTGASSTATIGYTAATVGIEPLFERRSGTENGGERQGRAGFPDRQREHEQ